MTENAVVAAKLPVLIIEDEPSVMSFVKAALERAGYGVETANSGVEALPILEAREFLGVVSDMRTPGGVEAQTCTRGSPRTGRNWCRNLSLLLVTL